jgi:hypothetical protein
MEGVISEISMVSQGLARQSTAVAPGDRLERQEVDGV